MRVEPKWPSEQEVGGAKLPPRSMESARRMPASAALTGSSQVQDWVSRSPWDFCPRVARENAEKTHTSSHKIPARRRGEVFFSATHRSRRGRVASRQARGGDFAPYLPTVVTPPPCIHYYLRLLEYMYRGRQVVIRVLVYTRAVTVTES